MPCIYIFNQFLWLQWSTISWWQNWEKKCRKIVYLKNTALHPAMPQLLAVCCHLICTQLGTCRNLLLTQRITEIMGKIISAEGLCRAASLPKRSHAQHDVGIHRARAHMSFASTFPYSLSGCCPHPKSNCSMGKAGCSQQAKLFVERVPKQLSGWGGRWEQRVQDSW